MDSEVQLRTKLYNKGVDFIFTIVNFPFIRSSTCLWSIYLSIRLFRIISILSKVSYFRLPDHLMLMECYALYFRCQCTQRKLQSICGGLSAKDRYQLNYFLCIKDFNAQTITCFKLNLFSSLIDFIYCRQNHERKTICLDIFFLSDRQWGIEPQHLLCRFLGISILQLFIIYRMHDYAMLTLSQ